MKLTTPTRIFCVAMLLLVVGTTVSGQQAAFHAKHRYKLIDLGTLGGPVSYGGAEGTAVLNNAGMIASSADTAMPDPNAPDLCFSPECFATHAVFWKNGTLTDLGPLVENYSSTAQAINDWGWSAGYAQNGLVDSILGVPQWRATFWAGRRIHDLGTLGGEQSLAAAITNNGEVIGMSTINTTFDPYAFVFPAATHPFIWKNGRMHDLGTLGGPDAFLVAACVNPDMVVGSSFTNDIPNETTQLPTQVPFLWDGRKMINLGTLGGTFGYAQCANHFGQIIGQSNLPGDVAAHPFLWQRGVLRDLGTLGGDNASPIWINDRGEVVGESDITGNLGTHAFLWRDGKMKDLGTLGDNSHATAVNSHTQVVGAYFISGRTEPPFRHAFLWEDGRPMVDLNDLVPANSGLELVDAVDINDRGEILGVGVPDRCFPDFCGHTYLLVPCASAAIHGCNDDGKDRSADVRDTSKAKNDGSTVSHSLPMTAKERVAAWLEQISRKSPIRRGVTPSR